MFTFRASITLTVMAFVLALAALLIAIQARTLRSATDEAASAYMDAASTKALGRLQGELTAVSSLVKVLATSSSVADSNERSETGRAIPLFKAALSELPQIDSIYAGFENGAWLQVRSTSDLSEDQRERLRATANADIVINLVRPTPSGDLPMRRIFQDTEGNEIGEIDLWNYGYDARKRPWYWQTMRSDRPHVSAPYLSFSIGAPVITVSAPLRGKVPGVLAADLKLDTFSDFVQAQRPGQHGTVMIFDQAGSIIAHPDFAAFVARAMTDPRRSQLPSIDEINSGLAAAVLRRSHNLEQNEGLVSDDRGQGYLFRLTQIRTRRRIWRQYPAAGGRERLRPERSQTSVQRTHPRDRRRPGLYSTGLGVRQHDVTCAETHYGAGAAASDAGGAQSGAGDLAHQGDSRTRRDGRSGAASDLVVRAFRSQGDRPQGDRQFDLDPARRGQAGDHAGLHRRPRVHHDRGGGRSRRLMQQTSRYFSVLTAAFLAEGGTVDKFIGDAVMVFWNAPDPQPDHVARACRAVLAAKAAGEKLNAEFEAEGLTPFFTRFGIHVGEAVVGNLGSTERMNYTALGNTVNLAARLEGLNKQVGTAVLASEDVYLRVRDQFEFRAFDAVVAKGMTKETRIFELVGAST